MSLQTYIFQIHTHPAATEHHGHATQSTKNKISSSHNSEASLQFVQRVAVWCSMVFQTSLCRQSARVSVAKPYTQHTRQKTLQQNDRLLSQKYHISLQEKIHPKYTSLHVGCALCASFRWIFVFLYLFGSPELGSGHSVPAKLRHVSLPTRCLQSFWTPNEGWLAAKSLQHS